MLIGLMAASDTHENNYFTEIAKTAKSFNMKVCKFSPENIDMNLKKCVASVLMPRMKLGLPHLLIYLILYMIAVFTD